MPHTQRSGDDADRDIATSRVVDAPRELVFDAFSDPARLARWWGPAGFTNTFDVFDLRPGGSWRFVMHAPNGIDYRNESVFEEIVRPERLVFRHLSGPCFQMTIALADRDGRTEISWRMRFDSITERDRVSTFAADANEQNLDRLEAELERMRAERA